MEVNDTDRDFGVSQLGLDANETVHFNSDDLETGNARKGLTGGTGAGAGDWRLVLESDLDIKVLAYIRTTDGFLTAMHDTVPRQGGWHRVATFNPGSNADQVSRLRLVNAGVEAARVTVTGIDGLGNLSQGSVSIAVPAGVSRTLTAQELEAGSDDLEGELGDGTGKWQLVVETSRPITILSLLSTPTAHLTNLSAGRPAQMVQGHNVMLRVVRVTPDWMSYASANGGWPAAVRRRESDRLKYFEAAIWEETASVHLYEFDDDFDPTPVGQETWTDEEKVEHRESYRIQQFTGMPPEYTAERSTFLRTAFESFATHIVERFPGSGHHLMYSGHGGPGGRLFGAMMNREDAAKFLAHWHEVLGRPLGVIDMGGPCNKSGFRDLETFCAHASFYIASDLPNGGYTMDEWTPEKWEEVYPETQYHNILAPLGTLRSSMESRIDLRRRRYEYSRQNMVENRTEQANYLYSCQNFDAFAEALRVWPHWDARLSASTRDVHRYLESHEAPAELVRRFESVIVHRADNRDFFAWEVEANGLLMPTD